MVSLGCPEFGLNLLDRVGSVTTENVLGWAACSELCSLREDCKYWVWHHHEAGERSYQCDTMTDYKDTKRDASTASGKLGCMEKGGELPLKISFLHIVYYFSLES